MASTAASHFGASLSYTELGPPDKIIPAGSSLRISSSAVVHGNIALNTCCSRTRRAINWVYCPPKSSTTTPPCSVFSFPCSFSTFTPVAPSILASQPLECGGLPPLLRPPLNRTSLRSPLTPDARRPILRVLWHNHS